jgi:transcriptional regulator with XRE-family HTH domain
MVRTRREGLGLSQARLARLSARSRATIKQLETGTIVDLGVTRLAHLPDLLRLSLRAEHEASRSRGLQAISQTASVSCSLGMTTHAVGRQPA